MNIKTLETLARSDGGLFCEAVRDYGLEILGRRERDPIQPTVQESLIHAVASTVTEDAYNDVELNEEQEAVYQLAEKYGYIVRVEDPSPNTIREEEGLEAAETDEPCFLDEYESDPEGTTERIITAVENKCGVKVREADLGNDNDFSIVVGDDIITADFVEGKTTDEVINNLCSRLRA